MFNLHPETFAPQLKGFSYAALQGMQKLIDAEMENRQPVAYKCPYCTFQGSTDELFKHLMSKENYSIEEDARLDATGIPVYL